MVTEIGQQLQEIVSETFCQALNMWPVHHSVMVIIPHILPLHDAGNPGFRGAFEATALENSTTVSFSVGIYKGG